MKKTNLIIASVEVKELLDLHLTDVLNIKGDDCGCTDEEQHEWHDRAKIIGDQAFIEHLHEKIMDILA